MYKRSLMRLSEIFSVKPLWVRRQWDDIFNESLKKRSTKKSTFSKTALQKLRYSEIKTEGVHYEIYPKRKFKDSSSK